MARKKVKSQTEWLVSARDIDSENAHSVVVYRLKSTVDDVTGKQSLQRLWVAARGYAGRGVFEEYSAVIYPEGDGYRITGTDYCCPDPENFKEEDLPYVAAKDYDIIAALWMKVEKLAILDEPEFGSGNLLSTLTVNVKIPKGSDCACSENWNGNLLTKLSKQWPLFLHF
jgi:hypothetical protein